MDTKWIKNGYKMNTKWIQSRYYQEIHSKKKTGNHPKMEQYEEEIYNLVLDNSKTQN